MRTFLDRLHDLKLNEVALRKNEISENNLRVKVETLGPGPDFRHCLLRKGNDPISLIAEVKSRAPGRKNVDRLDPETVVYDFEKGGAKAISVLTDESWFGGSLETLGKVSAVPLYPCFTKSLL